MQADRQRLREVLDNLLENAVLYSPEGGTVEVNGLGLGLANCKRIVELHAGAIWAESTAGKGSTFHVWLPVERSE